MSAAEEQVLTPEEIEELVASRGMAAFRDIGCTKPQGDDEVLDVDKIAQAVSPLVLAAKVDGLDERSLLAITKGDLTAKLLSEIIGPDDPEWDDAGEVGQRVWSWCERRVWSQTSPNVSGKVQQMARAKGLTLCQTKISRNSTLLPAVYVTDDLECLKQDFALPLKTSVRNAANKLAKNMAAAIETHPQLTKQLGKEVESGMKNATQLARATLALSAGESEE